MTHDSESTKPFPENVLLGTSSWTYAGWQGSIYNKTYKNEKAFKAECLQEYAAQYKTVGIDSTFYGPPKLSTLERYASQVPETFKWISKVWEEITIPQYAKLRRYGKKAGEKNLNFLNPETFIDAVLANYSYPHIKKHTGPFVFQFQTLNPKTLPFERFLELLESFLSKLPKEFQYAVEIRNPHLLNNEYFSILNKHNVTHCFNHWTSMPPLKQQMHSAAAAGGLQAPFFVSRILTPLGCTYQNAVNRFQPYENIQAPIPEMRADAARLAKRAVKLKTKAYIIVNNRSEGYAPGTISEIKHMILENLKND